MTIGKNDMDRTRCTTDMLDRATLNDAYDAYARGTEVGRLAAQLSVYPADLQRCFDKMSAERERMAAKPQGQTLGKLNDKLFEQLDRLSAIEVTDADALKAEVERTRAFEGLARTVIENANTVITAYRLKHDLEGETAAIPYMLEG